MPTSTDEFLGEMSILWLRLDFSRRCIIQVLLTSCRMEYLARKGYRGLDQPRSAVRLRAAAWSYKYPRT